MAVESRYTSLFNTLALPRLHESYRSIVFQQLYTNFTPIFTSVCWASGERGLFPDHQSGMVVLPGEERFMLEAYGIRFSPADKLAVHCQHHKEETAVKVGQEAEGPSAKVTTTHFCILPPYGRPIMCRIQPFRIARVPGDTRKVSILCDVAGLRVVLKRMGQQKVDQAIHDTLQMAISLWAFLTEPWWTFYEASFPPTKKYKELVTASFTLTDDVIISNIKNAPPVWRAEILAQMATQECPACTGSGIEFIDANMGGMLLPVPKRRFDLCRSCVLPLLGMTFHGVLIDPHTRRVLTDDGTEFRGDTVLAEDLKSPKK